MLPTISRTILGGQQYSIIVFYKVGKRRKHLTLFDISLRNITLSAIGLWNDLLCHM